MWVIAGVLCASAATLFIISFWYDAGVMRWLPAPLCVVSSIYIASLSAIKNTMRSKNRKNATLDKSETTSEQVDLTNGQGDVVKGTGGQGDGGIDRK